jgi:hypothetical protein
VSVSGSSHLPCRPGGIAPRVLYSPIGILQRSPALTLLRIFGARVLPFTREERFELRQRHGRDSGLIGGSDLGEHEPGSLGRRKLAFLQATAVAERQDVE